MKQRFTLSDVVAMAGEVREQCVDGRVMNIYDVDARSFVLRLNLAGDGPKVMLLIESGVRFVVTKYDARGGATKETSGKHEMPSGFCGKLRSLLKGKRVSDARVLGFDRVLCVRFGAGATATHLLLEMYAQGNVAVADADFVVLAALRTGGSGALEIGDAYEAQKKQQDDERGERDASSSVEGLRAFGAFAAAERAEQARAKALELRLREEAAAALAAETNFKKKKQSFPTPKTKKKGRGGDQATLTLRQLLIDSRSGLGKYGQDVVDHCATRAGVDANKTLDELSDEILKNLCESAAKEATSLFALLKEKKDGVILVGDDGKYAGFAPCAFAQHASTKSLKFESFAEAVDEYFRSFADEKLSNANENEKRAIESRVDKIKNDQTRRVEQLQADRATREARAATLEARSEDVDKVLSVLRAALDAGLKWDQVENYVDEEKKRGSFLAKMIRSIDFEKKLVTLALESLEFNQDDSEDDDDDEEEVFKSAPIVQVQVSLEASAMASAREQWATAKKARAKAAKTEVAAAQVVASAERQTRAQLLKREATAKAQMARVDRASQSALWFLKFSWFISSEGYLCICPRDKGQADMVLFQIFRRGKDAIVCVDGARDFPPCVVRGKRENDQWHVSPLALAEAGSFVACRSSAWTKRDRCAAFWIDDLRKGATEGWDLVFGSMLDDNFLAKQRHYLPATTLELHLSVVFLTASADCGYFGDDRVDDLIELGREEASSSPPKKLALGVSEEKKDHDDQDDDDEEPLDDEENQPEEEPKKKPYVSEVAPSVTSSTTSQSKKKNGRKKKKGRREESSDEDEPKTALDVSSKRGRHRRVVQAAATKASAPAAAVKSQQQKSVKSEEEDLARLLASEKAALGAIERMSAAKRGAWDRVAPMVADAVVPAMAFELGFVADNMTDADAVEALGLFYDAERTTVARETQRREEQLAREKRGGVAIQEPAQKERNVPALLAGICRRVANKRKKQGQQETASATTGDDAPQEQTEALKVEEEEDDDKTTIGPLTGRPREEDELLDCVVICAPSAAARHFKHSLKLTPGPAKKGKAAKDALEILTASSDATDAEKDLMKRIAQNDVIAALVAGVKISTVKLNELKQKRKVFEKHLKKKANLHQNNDDE